MRLVDLNPRWIAQGKDRIGMSFDCPHCHTQRLAILFHPSNVEFFSDGLTVARGWANCPVWSMTGDSFDNISLTPSVDTSAHGHWHGFITNGEVI